MLICMASSRWCLYTGVFLPTLLLILLPWKYFLKCDYKTTAGVPTPHSTENQNQPAGGRLDVKVSHWPDPSETSWAPFFKPEQTGKSPHETSVSKKNNPKTNQPKPKSKPRHWNSFETFPKLLLAQNSGVPVPNWFNGTDRGAAQGSLHGECFLEELLWAPVLELGGQQPFSTGTAHLNSHWQRKYAWATRPAAPSGKRGGNSRGSCGAARKHIWHRNGSQAWPVQISSTVRK